MPCRATCRARSSRSALTATDRSARASQTAISSLRSGLGCLLKAPIDLERGSRITGGDNPKFGCSFAALGSLWLILCFRSTKSLRSVQRLVNFLRGNRQALDPHAASIFNGIGNRRRRWDIGGFSAWHTVIRAGTFGLLGYRAPERRHVFKGRNFVLSEVRRPHLAIVNNHLLHEGVADPGHRPALDLPLMHERIEHGTRVMR